MSEKEPLIDTSAIDPKDQTKPAVVEDEEKIHNESKPKKQQHIQVAHKDHLKKNPYLLSEFNKNWKSISYNIACFLFEILFTTFFRKIDCKGVNNLKELLPKSPGEKQEPILLMCAPHANQFVDGGIVMQMTQKLTSLQSCSCIAASSFKQIVVGTFSRMTGGIPVPRQQDYLKPVNGFTISPIDENTVSIKPDDGKTDLKDVVNLMTKGMLGIKSSGNTAIQSFEKTNDSTNEYIVTLSKPFRSEVIANSTFLYAPRIDHSVMFEKVFNHLLTGGTLAIFPEGGSHDRPNLLPIKPGVAIMALGTVCGDKTTKVRIVPVGLNYFNRDKFRSRAVIEYGQPIVVDYENWGKFYEEDAFGTVDKLMTVLKKAIYAVTINTEDYEILQVIQACRRLLYTNHTDKITYNVVINRMLIKGYEHFQNDERIINVKNQVINYNKDLYEIGIRDHQVDLLSSLSALRAVKLLINRTVRIFFMAILAAPGFVLFSPVFIIAHYYSIKKAREGLKKSVVKIKGNDLLATWKLVVALGVAPVLYVLYSILMIKYDLVPLIGHIFNSIILKFIISYSFLVSVTYTALRAGEVGVDLLKSLKPLVVSLMYPQKKLSNLRRKRENLQKVLRSLCDELGPEIWPNYEEMKEELKKKLEEDYSDMDAMNSVSISRSRSRSRSRSKSRSEFYGSNIIFSSSGDDLSVDGETRGRKRTNSLGSIGSIGTMLGFGKIKDKSSDDESDEEFEIIDEQLVDDKTGGDNDGDKKDASTTGHQEKLKISQMITEKVRAKRT
ncbi:hypothetical protein HANVADRAFT_40007 [Hanseniaspora valbyensis NRRL Y-1626]|uniref:Phospholipid/glycerol acyltransferase domain-containing protein n=1 Tax=Hanseniaspora valbyensis NRRL Y-1626 TaxID=766949 RepID=A0A1B7TD58_9ASCO|nr:hypothetical protein HANVADRAFT_40007 [Hanseniaspora valbyensis NRRL Y-1626]